MKLRSPADRWFAEFNPLYFASALCVLGGVFLAACELPPDQFLSKLGIAAGVQGYQLLLIAGAWLLLRAGLKRPATILGLLAVLFVLDVTLDGERVFSHVGTLSLAPGMRARKALPASLVIAALGPLKLWALARVFRLRGAGRALAVAGAVVASLPLWPYAVELAGPRDAARPTGFLLVFWLGAAILAWACSPGARRWTSAWAGEGAAAQRVARLAGVVPVLVAALFGVHALAWSAFPGLGLTRAHLAPHVLAAAFVISARLAGRASRAAEPVAWIGAVVAIVASLDAPAVAPRWPAAAVSLCAGCCFLALARGFRMKLLLPAALSVAGGLYALARAPHAPGAAWPSALAAVLLAIALAQGDVRSLVASALAAGGTVLAVCPSAPLAPYAALVSGIWLAGWCWLFFPTLRGWVPFAATLGVLAIGAAVLWGEPATLGGWYGATGAAAFGVGVAARRREFQSAGIVAFAPLAAAFRDRWFPHSAGGWGVALLASGFLLLSAGVGVNLLIAARARARRAA